MTIDYTLKRGSHDSPEAGLCAMEWVSYLAGEKHSDSPICVSPVLQRFAIRLNDSLADEERQQLRPYLARCIGTANDGLDEKRGWMCADWAIRVALPTWLELAGITEAASLRAMPEITDQASFDTTQPTVRESRTIAYEKRKAWRAELTKRVREALKKRGVAADAAVAFDVAADAAVAFDVAAAADVNVAVVADVAVAADVAAAAYYYDKGWTAIKKAVKPVIEAKLKPTTDALLPSALELFDRMLPTETVSLPEPAQAEYERLLTA